jgi:hypothetical protein
MPKGKDPLNYSDPGWHKRQERWRHCSFLGHCAMGRQHMRVISVAETTTSRSKHLATHISGLLQELAESLKERVDD